MESKSIKVPVDNFVFQTSKKVLDEREVYVYLIKLHCLLEGIYIPNAELTLLSYYAAYGINPETEHKFREECKRNKQNMANTRYNLSKLGLITREENFNIWKIPSFLQYKLKGASFVININK